MNTKREKDHEYNRQFLKPEGLVLGACRSEAKAGEHALLADGAEQIKALIPAQAIAVADVGLSGQPPLTAPFGIADDHSGAVQRLIGRGLGTQVLGQM